MNIYKNKNPLPHNLSHGQQRYPLNTQVSSMTNTPPHGSNMNMLSQNFNGKNKYNGISGMNCEQGGNKKISMISNGKSNDFDLQCDEVLSKPKVLMQDSEFTCNETLVSLPRTNHNNMTNMDRIETKRMVERRQSGNINLVGSPNLSSTIDLQCNEELREVNSNNNKDNELEQVYKKVGSILEYYQRLTLHLQERVIKLEAENEALVLRTAK